MPNEHGAVPTREEFTRLDVETAGAIKNLGEKMDALVNTFGDHIDEDRELRKMVLDQQRQFDRMVVTLEGINNQLKEIAFGFRKSIDDSNDRLEKVKIDVEDLKRDRYLRLHDAQRVESDRIQRENRLKFWFAGFTASSAIIALVIGHFWKS